MRTINKNPTWSIFTCYVFFIIALISLAIQCSCSSRKKHTELNKQSQSSEVHKTIRISDSLRYKIDFESWLKENNQTLVIDEIFEGPIDSSGKKTLSRRLTTLSKESKDSGKKLSIDSALNKAIRATIDSSGTSVSKINNRSTVKTGVSTGKVIGVTLIVCVVGAALFFAIRQMKKVL